ncbi:hypothetical protein QTP88_011879 [Uroleucon formosanum]
MRNYSDENEGYSYIITVIDTVSKFSWAFELKNKDGISVSKAFEKIIEQAISQNQAPKLLHVDKGLEFKNKHFKKILQEYGIKMYHTQNEEKLSIIERFNRTLNSKMRLHFEVTNSKKWIKILQSLIDEYNFKDIHRSIGMRPCEEWYIYSTIDYQTSKITQPNEEPIKVAPRTETVIPISTTTSEGSTFVIHSQSIGDENLRLGNVLSTVKQRQLLAVVVNCTKNPVTIQQLQLKDISCTEFREVTMLVATHSQREPVDTSRLQRIKEAILIEYLNPEECNSLWKICLEFTNIFHLHGDTLSSTNTIHHEIRTPENATPINIRPYRLPYAHRQEIVKQINCLGDTFPIPRIDEISDQLGRSRYYSTLDLASEYHQMLFGLIGAPSTFQRLMNSVLIGINEVKTFVYLDDIIIYATDLLDHESKLREFLRKEVIYLGHLIIDRGVEPYPEKIQCIKEHPTPKNVVKIKQFLGNINQSSNSTISIATPMANKEASTVAYNFVTSFDAFMECPRILSKLLGQSNMIFGKIGYVLDPVSHSGILFQPIGTVYPVVNEFKLVRFLNISALDTNHKDIVAFHKQLETFCDKYI